MTVNVGFRDSVLGCSRQITLEFDVKCSVCSGTGASSGRVRREKERGEERRGERERGGEHGGS